MPQEEFSNYRLIFKSDPTAIDFGKVSIRNFLNISLGSDVFSFYPYGEVNLSDTGGMIIDRLVFVEGLKIDFRIGNEDDGYVGHDFFWSGDQINNTTVAEFISGDNIFLLSSNYKNLDNVKSRVWSSSTLSSAVDNLIKTDFNITNTDKIKITSTTGSDSWYQINSTNEKFLMTHRAQAYTSNHPNSPYLSFINTNGDFYFATVEALFKEQKPVSSYKIQISENALIDEETLKSYDLIFPGEPVNGLNYKKNIYITSKTGAPETTINTIESFFTGKRNDKALFRQQLQDNTSGYEYIGIQETTQDKYRKLGQRNFEFVDSIFPIRMNTIVDFNPNCVSGKLVDLEIGSVFEDRQILSELSGDWLILADKHFMDQDARPVSMLTLAKSKISVNSQHTFYNDFLS